MLKRKSAGSTGYVASAQKRGRFRKSDVREDNQAFPTSHYVNKVAECYGPFIAHTHAKEKTNTQQR